MSTTDGHGPAPSAGAIEAALAADASGESARRLIDQLPAEAAAAIERGSYALVDELTVVWIVALPGAEPAPVVVSEVGTSFRHALTRLGDSDRYAAAATFPEGSAMRWSYETATGRFGGGQLELFRIVPERRERAGVPKGRLVAQPRWRSNVFAGTVRDWWTYVPAQLDPAQPAAFMVFQDGGRFYKDHVPTIFDNLIAAGAMPPTVGIFIEPGTFADTTAPNRSFEYDTLSDQYARFLIDEILPEVERRYPLRHDPAAGAIGGMSSGGICSFTVAWQRPDRFSKVLSWVGSFTNIACGPTLRDGGHNYPALIRRMPPKPIRVYLQDGENDLNDSRGSWWLANLEMADALRYAGYDHQIVKGQGFHSIAHGVAVMPDALRWLWRDHRG